MSVKTRDEAPTRLKFYTTEKLGRNQTVTPEGFLVCTDVPIARLGTMLYSPDELPLAPGNDGLLRIDRGEDELFNPETIASFEGKAVTEDHPPEDVTPDNWRDYARGTVLNVRRGANPLDDLLIADLLITDRSMIEAVRDGKREISCGYDADYEQTEPGRGVQRNIIANHVALVAMGRCGSRCAIGDQDMAKKPTWMDRIRSAFKSKDEAAMEEALKEAPTNDADGDEDEDDGKGKTGDSAVLAAITTLGKRLDTMDAQIKALATKDSDEEREETKDGDDEDDGDGKTKDTALKRFRDAVSRAEILSPGLRLPTTDAKATAKTIDAAVCSCQRKALTAAYATDAGKQAIDPFLGGGEPTFDTMDAATLQAVFVGASELLRAKNNGAGLRSGVTTQDFGRAPVKTADLNAKHKAFWNRNQAS